MMPLRKIGRTYRHFKRYRQILKVLVKYGFGDVMERLRLNRYVEVGKKIIRLNKKRDTDIKRFSRVERIRMALEELGPTFIKLGQFLSVRPDLVPLELTKELKKLQDSVPALPFAEVKKGVEEEFKTSLETNFSFFDTKPFAAASIAQVHLAKLLDRREVAVKIRRPGIKEIINTDLEIMLHLANIIEKHYPESEFYDPVGIVRELSRSIKKELDFTYESRNIKKFAQNFKDDKIIYVPMVIEKLSTEKVLTLEYVKGIKVSDYDKLESAGLNRKIIARNGATLILKQIFDYGFFHGDPHPGNILILENNVICFLDFGIMGRLSEEMKNNFANMIMGIIQKDTNIIITTIEIICNGDIQDREELREEIDEFIDYYYGISLGEINFGKLLNELIEAVIRHKLKIPSNFFLMEKALITVEGLGKGLDPDFNMVSLLRPFTQKLISKKLSLLQMVEDTLKLIPELSQLLKEMPTETREILQKLKTGKLKVEFEHKGLKPMLSTGDKISNRLSFSIVIAALIIGSSLIVNSKMGPLLWGFPAVGIIGFLAAGVFGLYLIIAILRSGRL